MLHQVKSSPTVIENVLNAFKEIHARGICHGDIRFENILVRPNESVVVIDFEASGMTADPYLLDAEMDEVKALVSRLNMLE
jgi:thiamine kinase-like enzyme